eukprot:scaffold54716_cov57-Phaeocystis_antarctica.AAC.1
MPSSPSRRASGLVRRPPNCPAASHKVRRSSHAGRASWPFERTRCAALRRAASSSAAAGRSAPPRATSISAH